MAVNSHRHFHIYPCFMLQHQPPHLIVQEENHTSDLTSFSYLIYPVVWLTAGAPLLILQPASSTPRGSQLTHVRKCTVVTIFRGVKKKENTPPPSRKTRVLCTPWLRPGGGIMEADDRQVTVFTVQPSFQHRHSTNRVSRSVTIVGERAVTPHHVVRRRW